MVTIAIPSYMQEDTLEEAVQSALNQDYTDKEILIIVDKCDDNTNDVAYEFVFEPEVRIISNEIRLGIGANLAKCMREAKGDYIIFLCGDDMFADPHVVSDMVRIFEADSRVGVIGRHYYQFLNGYLGAIAVVRDNNILVSSVNPSGMGFRKAARIGEFSNGMFIEMPYMVKKVLAAGWGYQIMDYDTIAVRIHHNNTCVKSFYYTGSPTKSFATIVPGAVFYEVLITLKIRCPRLLLKEIFIIIGIKPSSLFNIKFWSCLILALLPGRVLAHLSNWYRHRVQRHFCHTITRRG